jgi:drug/metabolite transporter (DMT)-like permease
MARKFFFLLLLTLAALAWGATFSQVKRSVEVYPVAGFIGIRFSIAALILLPLAWRGFSRETTVIGIRMGVLLFVIFFTQTLGLRWTSATNSGFITGLYVVFTPAADRLLYGNRLRPVFWAAVGLCALGMALMTGAAPSGITAGDWLTLVCAMVIGIHLSMISKYAPDHDPAALCTVQLAVTAVLAFIAWPITAAISPGTDAFAWPDSRVWFDIAICAVFATAGAMVVQTWAQREISATKAAIIMSTEPIFAAMFGIWLLAERPTGMQGVGAGLILLAIVVAEVLPRMRARRNRAQPV